MLAVYLRQEGGDGFSATVLPTGFPDMWRALKCPCIFRAPPLPSCFVTHSWHKDFFPEGLSGSGRADWSQKSSFLLSPSSTGLSWGHRQDTAARPSHATLLTIMPGVLEAQAANSRSASLDCGGLSRVPSPSVQGSLPRGPTALRGGPLGLLLAMMKGTGFPHRAALLDSTSGRCSAVALATLGPLRLHRVPRGLVHIHPDPSRCPTRYCAQRSGCLA